MRPLSSLFALAVLAWPFSAAAQTPDVARILDDDLGLLLRGEVVWAKADGASGSCAWGSYRSPTNPVLFYNPLSGGGKAARFHLADEARRRGIEPVELQRGDDLETLVRDAVDPPPACVSLSSFKAASFD